MAEKINVHSFGLDSEAFDDAFEHAFEEIGEDVHQDEADGAQSFSADARLVRVKGNEGVAGDVEEKHDHKNDKAGQILERAVKALSQSNILSTKRLPNKRARCRIKT
jgi:hypothetical protein